mmetsp:Transcript_12901/g.34766  ORF Transcript_12901/g.34766 Transcript_12901/m.34766 type:complete len:164 (+) Transcript_12901:103-594(+)|eukprot:CAMPEP_0185838188 /NCGR_PEP_ID=MMETSP1353-20130828/12673_1 /TAXON_ID=1077150 /ORGANISM="Erythrolobus australicus, Strain CCMP3124" /LENGTH=163 /DNA_ID=CAMNT_0028537213 /DNA_START=11 /DNA_END=502 /DNA_ORIENTATION=+
MRAKEGEVLVGVVEEMLMVDVGELRTLTKRRLDHELVAETRLLGQQLDVVLDHIASELVLAAVVTRETPSHAVYRDGAELYSGLELIDARLTVLHSQMSSILQGMRVLQERLRLCAASHREVADELIREGTSESTNIVRSRRVSYVRKATAATRLIEAYLVPC